MDPGSAFSPLLKTAVILRISTYTPRSFHEGVYGVRILPLTSRKPPL